MRRSEGVRVLLVAGVALLGGVATLHAAKEPSGQDLYKSHCKVCHGPKSESGEYTPMTLIQDQWTRFFDQKYEARHQALPFPGVEGKTVTDVITPDMLAKIRKFAVDHAADSEQPMTCGN